MAITFPIDNAGPNANGSYDVVARSYCKRIKIQEDFDSASPPTADLRQYIPANSGPVKVSKGTPAIYAAPGESHYYPFQVVGQIKTASGSIIVQQTEGDEV